MKKFLIGFVALIAGFDVANADRVAVSSLATPEYTVACQGVDDTTRLQAALNLGIPFRLSGDVCVITQSINFVSGSKMFGYGTVISMPAASFNNTSASLPQRYGTNAVGFNILGSASDYNSPIEDVAIYGVTIRGDFVDGNNNSPILAINVDNLIIQDVTIEGFAVGTALRVMSGRNSYIINNTIRDWYTNLNWGGPTSAQQTGIEIDEGIVTNASSSLTISGNSISNLIQGPVAIAAFGYQSDGINLVRGEGIIVSDNQMSDIGEGIDTFSDYSVFTGNNVRDAYYFCYKLAHGATYNSWSNNSGLRCGLSGVAIGTGGASSVGNTWSGGTFIDIDPDNLFGNDSACVTLATEAVGLLIQNNTLENIVCDPQPNGDYIAKLDLSQASVNRIRMLPIRAGDGASGGWVSISTPLNQGFVFAVDNPTDIRVTLSGAQTIDTASENIVFNTEERDTRNEFNTTNGEFICQIPGKYEFRLAGRTASSLVGGNLTLGILRNGSGVRSSTLYTSNNVTTSLIPIVAEIQCAAPGDTFFAAAGASAGSYDLTANSQLTYLEIRSIDN